MLKKKPLLSLLNSFSLQVPVPLRRDIQPSLCAPNNKLFLSPPPTPMFTNRSPIQMSFSSKPFTRHN